MYERAEDLQRLAPAAAQFRRHAAGLAVAIVLASAPAAADTPVPVTIGGYVQVDAVPWSQDSVDELDPATSKPLNQDRFLIRRARIRAEAKRDSISGAIELDGNTVDGAVARLVSAQVSYSLVRDDVPLVVATAGLFKTPFGSEVPASERDKPFLEPPAFARALFPGSYDAGLMLRGEYGVARWAVAIVNGSPVGDARWQGKDPSSSYDVVGRLGAAVDGPYRSRFEAGVSALTGTALHPGAPATKDELQWIDANQDGIVQTTELVTVPGMLAMPSQPYDHDAIGFDAAAHWCVCKVGTGTAFFEAVLATNLDRGLQYADPIAVSRDLRHLGFAVGLTQDLGRYARVGVRYDWYNADRDAFEREGISLVGTDQVFGALGVMAAAHWNDAQFLVQYDHERNPYGRGDDGMPTTRSADRITLRAQVGF